MAIWNYDGIDDELRARFWDRVIKLAGRNACWEWQGRPARSGYGQLCYRAVSPHPLLTHRLSWALAHGPIPSGQFVLHKCDNPTCVRPSHLFLGTQRDNTEDRDRKGRTASGDSNGARTHPERNSFIAHRGSGFHGSQHPMAKLSRDDVIEIRRRLAAGDKPAVLARDLELSITHVCRIRDYLVWKVEE